MNNIKITLSLVLTSISIYTFSQNALDECKKKLKEKDDENSTLSFQINKLNGKIESLEKGLETLQTENQKLIAEKDSIQQLYIISLEEKVNLQKAINRLQTEIDSTAILLKKYKNNNNEEYNRLSRVLSEKMLEISALNEKSDGLLNDYKITKSLVESLQAEINDNIFIRKKKVFFNSKQYDYGETIIFVKYQSNEAYQFSTKEEWNKYVGRLSNLVNRFRGLGAKLKITGFTSSDKKSNYNDPKAYCQKRANHFRNYVLNNKLLEADYITKIDASYHKGEQGGVALSIVKK